MPVRQAMTQSRVVEHLQDSLLALLTAGHSGNVIS